MRSADSGLRRSRDRRGPRVERVRNRGRRARERLRHTRCCKSAGHAALRLDNTVAGRLAEQHHRAARAARRRRMIGKDHARARRMRDIDEPFRNGCRARMQVHDVRPRLRNDCPEALGRDLVGNAIGQIEPRAQIGCESIDRQASMLIGGGCCGGRGDSVRIAKRGKPLRQPPHIHFSAATGVGKIGVGNMQDVGNRRLPLAGLQIRFVRNTRLSNPHS